MHGVRFRALTIDPRKYNIGPEIEKEVTRYMSDRLWEVVGEVRPYPPERPNQVYVRTGTLFAGWNVRIRRTLEGLIGTIENTATDPKSGLRYMVKVQGALQTAMHEETGWKRVDLAASAIRRRYRADLLEIYRRFLRRKGIGY